MTRRCLGLFAIGTVLGWASISQAYGKETHAALLTRYAWHQHLRCAGKSEARFSRAELEAGNRAQDRWWSLERLLNWHFHHRPGIENGFIDRSAESILSEQAEQLERALASGESLGSASEEVGAVLHYLQDMTVPAHAVPVFHVGGDPFDHFWEEMPSAQRQALRTQLSTRCDCMIQRARSLAGQGIDEVARALYEETAADTVQALTTAIPSEPSLTWSALWPKHGAAIAGMTCRDGCLYEHESKRGVCWSRKGFGCYHPEHTFAREESRESPVPSASESSAFFVERATKAVEVSTVFLLYLSQRQSAGSVVSTQ